MVNVELDKSDIELLNLIILDFVHCGGNLFEMEKSIELYNKFNEIYRDSIKESNEKSS
jgi:hypothetical protein